MNWQNARAPGDEVGLLGAGTNCIDEGQAVVMRIGQMIVPPITDYQFPRSDFDRGAVPSIVFRPISGTMA